MINYCYLPNQKTIIIKKVKHYKNKKDKFMCKWEIYKRLMKLMIL